MLRRLGPLFLVVAWLPARSPAQPSEPSEPPAGPAPEIAGPAAQVALEATRAAEDEAAAAGGTAAAETAEAVVGLLLDDLLRLAEEHPLVGAARADVDAAEARLDQAHWAPYSNWSFQTMFTFVPPAGAWEDEVRAAAGRTVDNQWDRSILDWGPWIRLGVSGGIPLWTFGKITGAWDAAEAGVRAADVGVQRARDEVSWQVRRAYLTLLLARDILYLIEDGRGYIDDAREETQKRIDSGEGGGSTVDLYKIDALAAEVDARELQARRLERLALAGLALLTGVEDGAAIADVPLAPFGLAAASRADYVELAGRERTDLRMLEAGIAAQRAKVEIETARYYPDLLLTASAGYAYSSVTVDQHNPWVSDPFNTSGVGAALVLDYPLDFVADHARVEEAEATLRRLEQQREALGQAAEVEVVDAFESLEEARGRMGAYDRARVAAKRWLIAMLQGMTLGLQEASDMTEALVSFFQNELHYLNAVYDLDLAWARLALATGSNLLEGAVFSDSWAAEPTATGSP
ncbi:MAG: TolC family protein [Deltaproteobacteria bacterium]|nr:TolC family protein [Deltaproteobacteria bacterium]